MKVSEPELSTTHDNGTGKNHRMLREGKEGGGGNGANTSMTRIIIDLSQCAAALDLSYAKCGQISSTQGSPFNSDSTQPGVQEGILVFCWKPWPQHTATATAPT